MISSTSLGGGGGKSNGNSVLKYFVSPKTYVPTITAIKSRELMNFVRSNMIFFVVHDDDDDEDADDDDDCTFRSPHILQ
jgi:hypothetical protein